jgi:glycosyltransferase involved in cell wall biosynthesis
LAGARALLLPSFAEGYGMPVAEALAASVPVIASDLAALREVGGDVPDYLDPIDGLGWYNAIVEYACDDSPARQAQLDRLLKWSPTRWGEHMDIVLGVLDEVQRRASGRRV